MASAKEPLIKIQGLTKEYYNRVVVDNINLEIWDSCFAFLGPNGAGKTTTILMLLGLVKPSNFFVETLNNLPRKPLELMKASVVYCPQCKNEKFRMYEER